MPLLTVYDLHDDHQRIRWMQEATMTTRDFGLEPTHGLFGSTGWWLNIENGNLPSFRQSGLITNVYNVGDGDHPEFSMADESGIETNWKREVTRRRTMIYTSSATVWSSITCSSEHAWICGCSASTRRRNASFRSGSTCRARAVTVRAMPGATGLGLRLSDPPGCNNTAAPRCPG